MKHQVCRVTNLPFQITEAELDFLQKVALTNPQLKVSSLPTPTTSPSQLSRLLCCYGNGVNLFRTQSSLSSKNQLSRYNPKWNYKVATVDEFWNEVENQQFAKDYDFTRPFFEQWNELMHSAYLLPLGNVRVENSEYANGARDVKNCYLIAGASECQDCMYCFGIFRSSDLIDCLGANTCQLCYSCADVENCYECQHCRDCYNCNSCFGCVDCRSCNNCIGCTGLTAAEYHVFNKKLGKEDYLKFLKENNLGSWNKRTELLQRTAKFQAQNPHKINRIINCEDCSGAYLFNSQNLFNCYHAAGSKDCGYMLTAMNTIDCWYGYASDCELQYQTACYKSYNCHYSYLLFDSQNCFYSFQLFNNCNDCFGCVGLKKKSYCILNKQYSKEEYLDLLPRIIAHMNSTKEWGEFFPPQMSPHSYQESWNNYYNQPLSEKEIVLRGFRNSNLPFNKAPEDALSAEGLADDIDHIDQSILSKALICQTSSQGYSLQKKEFEYYKKMRIPVPRQHWKFRLDALADNRERFP